MSDLIGEKMVFSYDIKKNHITIKKCLGKKITNEIFTFSENHIDSQILKISTKFSENICNMTYDTENKKKLQIDGFPVGKYGVLINHSDIGRKKNEFGIGREFDIDLNNMNVSAGDEITLEIIGKNYRDFIIRGGWSSEVDGVVGDYISYFGTGYILKERIIIDRGQFSKTVEVSTKIKKQKTLTEVLLMKIR